MKIFALCVLAGVAGCASQPQQPLTRDQAINQDVAAAYLAGRDGSVVYENLHLMACLSDAEADAARERSAAIEKCHKDWPMRQDIVQQARQPVTTCHYFGGQAQCSTQ